VYRWWSDVETYPSLDAQTQFGPAYLYEYSTRDAYGSGINWGPDDPLNATWWHLVTERASHSPTYPLHSSLHLNPFFLPPEMEANSSLVSSVRDSRAS
jgi:hypothetical protein